MTACPCPDCATDRGEPTTEIDLRWRAWSATVLAGGDRRDAYDRYLHPETRVAAETIGGVTR